MPNKKFLLPALLSCITSCALHAQPNRIDGFFPGKRDIKNYMIYYPFYNGVQMIEVDNLAMGMDEAHYMDGIRPISTTWAWRIPRVENAYVFRNSKGVILKQLNTVKKYQPADFTAPDQLAGKIISHRKRREGEKARRETDYHPFYEKFTKKSFADFLFLVKEGNKKYMIIDTLGNRVAPGLYDSIRYENNSYYIKDNGLWGLMNASFQVVIQPKYKALGYLRPGIHYAITDKCGIINSRDSTLAPFIYQSITSGTGFYITHKEVAGTAPEQQMSNVGQVYALLDMQFREIPAAEYSYIEKEGEQNIYYTARKNCWGIVDGRTGRELVPCKYIIKPRRLNSGHYQVAVRTGGTNTYGLLDTAARELSEPIYDETGDYLDNAAPVKYKGKWGFIN